MTPNLTLLSEALEAWEARPADSRGPERHAVFYVMEQALGLTGDALDITRAELVGFAYRTLREHTAREHEEALKHEREMSAKTRAELSGERDMWRDEAADAERRLAAHAQEVAGLHSERDELIRVNNSNREVHATQVAGLRAEIAAKIIDLNQCVMSDSERMGKHKGKMCAFARALRGEP